MSLPRGFGPFLATVGALACALAFAAWALMGSAYMTCSSDGGCSTQPLADLVATQVLLVLIPAAVCLAGWFLLRRYCTTGSRAARAAMTVLVTVTVAFSIVSGFSIGMLLMPMALLLWLALATTPAPPAE